MGWQRWFEAVTAVWGIALTVWSIAHGEWLATAVFGVATLRSVYVVVVPRRPYDPSESSISRWRREGLAFRRTP